MWWSFSGPDWMLWHCSIIELAAMSSLFSCVFKWIPSPNLDANFRPQMSQGNGLCLACTFKICLSSLFLNKNPFSQSLQVCGRTGRWITWCELNFSFVSKLFPQVSQLKFLGIPWLCLALCLLWFPLVLLIKPHSSHLYFRSEEWEVMWAVNVALKLKLRPQTVHRYGLSSVCLQRMCVLRAEEQLKSRPHWLQLNAWKQWKSYEKRWIADTLRLFSLLLLSRVQDSAQNKLALSDTTWVVTVAGIYLFFELSTVVAYCISTLSSLQVRIFW